MHKCANAMCNKLINLRGSYITTEVVGCREYWCSQECFDEWNRQNLVFKVATKVDHKSKHRTKKWWE